MLLTIRTAILPLVFLAIWVSAPLQAHDVIVHKKISNTAALSAENFLSFLDDQFGGEHWATVQFLFNSQKRTAIGWMEEGSVREDDGTQVKNHFYSPPSGRLLSDFSEFPFWLFPYLPPDRVNSFEWASSHVDNSESWNKARQYQLAGLNSTSRTLRDANLGHMFNALGHVLHLNQDLSQPGHTRDDNHFWKRYIEPFGSQIYWRNSTKPPFSGFPYSERTWAQWRQAGFEKLEDFWNRHLYFQQAQALDDDRNGPPEAKLGLAEFSNGNFLSEDALYKEMYKVNDKHYYAFPSILSSTDFRSRRQNPVGGASYELFKDKIARRRIFISKKLDGIPVGHHSVLSYLGFKFDPGLVLKYGVSINSSNVLQDYHSILIPKAIEYSAGILDYFFRGRLDVYISLGNAPGKYSLSIKNLSGQPFQGGSFKLYYDNASGVRAEPPSFTTTYGTSLADNGTITGEFIAPSGEVSSYVLVYKGTIGVNGSDAIDSVDADIAIAAKRFVTCTPPSGAPTASSLAYDDAADLGTIHLDRSSPKTAFGSYPLGVYRVQYVGDTYRCHIDPDYPGTQYQPNQPVWGTAWAGTQPPLAGTKAYYFSSSGEIETPFLPGFYDCVDQNAVVTYTLNQNQNITPFTHQSGAISLAPDADGDICSNWEIPDPGGPEYKLQRLKSFFPQPARVRIKDYATLIKPLIPGCSACPTVTGVAEWDGSFPNRQSVGQGSAQWDTPAIPLAINGGQINTALVRYANVPPDFGNPNNKGWALEIYCTPPGAGSTLLWRGIKVIGNDPTGTYFNENLGTGLPMCANQPCCLTVESY